MAAPRTMILLDPDLETGVSPQAKPLKRSEGASQAALLRTERIPSRQTLARFQREAQAAVKLSGRVSVLLTTDAAIRRLNRQFRGKDKATDVLSFPAGEAGPMKIAGDVAISIPTARRQAEDCGHALAIEIKVLMLHGLLHLAGYDHETDEGEMARRERKLRANLGLPQGLIERATETRGLGATAHAHSAPVSARVKSGSDTRRHLAAAPSTSRRKQAPKGPRR